MPKNHHALDTGGGAAVTIEGDPCLERPQANSYGKSWRKALWRLFTWAEIGSIYGQLRCVALPAVKRGKELVIFCHTDVEKSEFTLATTGELLIVPASMNVGPLRSMMSQSKIDRIILRSPLYMLAGAVCWFAGLMITGVYLAGYGLMALVFARWRTEPGLWIFGAFLLCLFCSVHVALAYYLVYTFLAGNGPGSLVAVDLSLASEMLGVMIRFLWAISSWNYRSLPPW